MQVYEDSLKEKKPPCPGSDCPICSGKQRLHKHGTYCRYRGTDGARLQKVQRFVCRRCGHTWSVIPAGMMPYRSLEVERFEALSDAQFGTDSETDFKTGSETGSKTGCETDSETQSASPAAPTEKEAGCAQRAWKALSNRIPLLQRLFGQQMPVLAADDTSGFWRSLRRLGSTNDALAALAHNFMTSLLACYRSLRPFWDRGTLPLPDG